MQDLSIVIVAQDEERKIAKTLDAVKAIAHEIILVDSGSTDRTVEIAKARQAVCYYRKWQGFADQKNFAISLAKCPWILSLDADEVVSDRLLLEIKNVLSSESSEQFAGYKIPRILYVGDMPLMHGGFYPDAQLRLFKKGQGQFNDRVVHESVKVDGNVGRLKNPILHYSYTDLAGFARAMDKYARLSAQEFSKRSPSIFGAARNADSQNNSDSGRMQCAVTVGLNPTKTGAKPYGKLLWRTSRLNQWLHPCWTFFYRFIVRGGFLDGELGWQANLIYCDYVRKKIVYLRDAIAKTSC
jgi:glycosyltransferase involved in cell wall biosynthesis